MSFPIGRKHDVQGASVVNTIYIFNRTTTLVDVPAARRKGTTEVTR
jgi:hypothetical protein